MIYDRKIYDRKYYEKNKTPIKKYLKEYYQLHKELIKERSNQRHGLKRDEILIKKREYYERNKEYVLNKNKQWYRKNLKKVRNYIKNYMVLKRKIDPNFNMKSRLRARLNIVLKKYANGKKFNSFSYGVNYLKIIEHLKPFPKDIKNHHIDHIKPLCSFDLTDPKQIKIAFSPENHQWLTIEQNLKKGKST